MVCEATLVPESKPPGLPEIRNNLEDLSIFVSGNRNPIWGTCRASQGSSEPELSRGCQTLSSQSPLHAERSTVFWNLSHLSEVVSFWQFWVRSLAIRTGGPIGKLYGDSFRRQGVCVSYVCEEVTDREGSRFTWYLSLGINGRLFFFLSSNGKVIMDQVSDRSIKGDIL